MLHMTVSRQSPMHFYKKRQTEAFLYRPVLIEGEGAYDAQNGQLTSY
jgi:hypothetical protein